MNGLLAIAAAFLDLMTNPQHGIEVNEEYSLRFHQALIDDPEFANSFATLALSAEDVESLPICAWPWYLQWRAGNGSPPSRDFLDALFDYTDDPAIRLSVVRSAVWEEYPASTPADHPPADAEHRSDDDSGDRRFTGADPQPSDAVAERERRRCGARPGRRERNRYLSATAGRPRQPGKPSGAHPGRAVGWPGKCCRDSAETHSRSRPRPGDRDPMARTTRSRQPGGNRLAVQGGRVRDSFEVDGVVKLTSVY